MKFTRSGKYRTYNETHPAFSFACLFFSVSSHFLILFKIYSLFFRSPIVMLVWNVMLNSFVMMLFNEIECRHTPSLPTLTDRLTPKTSKMFFQTTSSPPTPPPSLPSLHSCYYFYLVCVIWKWNETQTDVEPRHSESYVCRLLYWYNWCTRSNAFRIHTANLWYTAECRTHAENVCCIETDSELSVSDVWIILHEPTVWGSIQIEIWHF